ncbi:glycoside hydrolase family 3 N-terminal domain-containing protein [Xylanimonas sp. McL0601]|uniref:glycoside hydrolase family 3 N-terminal domain-containing protein n=1 Tax=Xylanimonas sp. McL0601 TaxID=3414739 RepID=UPI003CF2B7D3
MIPDTRAGTTAVAVVLSLALVTLAAGCTGGSAPSPSPAPPVRAASPTPSPSPSGPSSPTASPSPTSAAPSASPRPTPTPTPTPTATHTASGSDPVADWTLEQKVGQLVMVGMPLAGSRATTAALVSQRHVGGVFLHGRTDAGVVRVRNLVDAYQRIDHDPTPLLVATDQEGGQVQTLRGPGFSTIPPATEQVKLPNLEANAATWGRELVAAGVDVDLAPVADLVPPELASANAPVGHFQRNYGFTAPDVVAGASAFADGMRAAGVTPTIKHFPGLGRVTENTDTTAGVTDDVTTADDASVGVFRDVLAQTASGSGPSPWVMVSTAIYSRIDAERPGAFSPAVVGLLRERVGYHGVVVTDDVSAAKQVQAWSPGERAVLAVDAGCDIVLASADPSTANAMLDALLAKAKSDPAFAAKVDAAAARVVAAKG